MFKMYASVCVALMATAGTVSAQTDREPSSLGKKYVGCVDGSAANGYSFSVPAAPGSSTTRPRRYGLVAGKGLTVDISTLVNKRVEIVATLAEDQRTMSASSSSGASSSTGGKRTTSADSSKREASASREVLAANVAQPLSGSCAP